MGGHHGLSLWLAEIVTALRTPFHWHNGLTPIPLAAIFGDHRKARNGYINNKSYQIVTEGRRCLTLGGG